MPGELKVKEIIWPVFNVAQMFLRLPRASVAIVKKRTAGSHFLAPKAPVDPLNTKDFSLIVYSDPSYYLFFTLRSDAASVFAAPMAPK